MTIPHSRRVAWITLPHATIFRRLPWVARKLGHSMAQVAYAWAATRPSVTTPIYGISKLQQFDDALASLTLRLDPADVAKMEACYLPRPIAGHS